MDLVDFNCLVESEKAFRISRLTELIAFITSNFIGLIKDLKEPSFMEISKNVFVDSYDFLGLFYFSQSVYWKT